MAPTPAAGSMLILLLAAVFEALAVLPFFPVDELPVVSAALLLAEDLLSPVSLAVVAAAVFEASAVWEDEAASVFDDSPEDVPDNKPCQLASFLGNLSLLTTLVVCLSNTQHAMKVLEGRRPWPCGGQ